MPRIIGLDLGEKRIGVAVSDETMTISSAADTIAVSNARDSVKKIRDLAVFYQALEIVVGLPLNMNGTRGPQADKVEKFAQKIRAACVSCQVLTFDERLTTSQGSAILISAGMSRKKRRMNIDKLAAQIMLQAYLDYKKNKYF
ncbi:MAG: Holliday junction resolvase RuvX [Candidatus Omnitrophica bacterium]|nr:Holliday junction resolvase RuvX [Candidatus Omnitrophota bacterium]